MHTVEIELAGKTELQVQLTKMYFNETSKTGFTVYNQALVTSMSMLSVSIRALGDFTPLGNIQILSQISTCEGMTIDVLDI